MSLSLPAARRLLCGHAREVTHHQPLPHRRPRHLHRRRPVTSCVGCVNSHLLSQIQRPLTSLQSTGFAPHHPSSTTVSFHCVWLQAAPWAFSRPGLLRTTSTLPAAASHVEEEEGQRLLLPLLQQPRRPQRLPALPPRPLHQPRQIRRQKVPQTVLFLPQPAFPELVAHLVRPSLFATCPRAAARLLETSA